MLLPVFAACLPPSKLSSWLRLFPARLKEKALTATGLGHRCNRDGGPSSLVGELAGALRGCVLVARLLIDGLFELVRIHLVLGSDVGEEVVLHSASEVDETLLVLADGGLGPDDEATGGGGGLAVGAEGAIGVVVGVAVEGGGVVGVLHVEGGRVQ